MQRIGGPPADQWVREGGSLLSHVHIEDTDGLLDRHWAPGEGSINWFPIFDALSDLEHQPRLILEIPASKLRAGARWLSERGFVV
jgi:sugar phosphate isomerase/epimerase